MRSYSWGRAGQRPWLESHTSSKPADRPDAPIANAAQHLQTKTQRKQIKSIKQTEKVFLLKKLILLFSKDALNWSKVTVKIFIMLQNIYFSKKCCSFELSIHHRILKMFLEQQISILEWILMNHATLKTGVMDAESCCRHRNKLHTLKYIKM